MMSTEPMSVTESETWFASSNSRMKSASIGLPSASLPRKNTASFSDPAATLNTRS